jgi:two-component system, LytTR family, response regulator
MERYARSHVRVLVAANQGQSRNSLIRLFERNEDAQVIGEASSGAKAIRAVITLRPDLLLLDSQLTDMTGFEVLRTLRLRDKRRTILMTDAEPDQAAVLANGAAECLLKPIDAQAFAAALGRVRDRLRPRSITTGEVVNAGPRLLADYPPPVPRPLFLVGERANQLYPLEPDQIDFVESAGNYVKYHVGRTTYMARDSIKRLDETLTPVGFVRIERSILLNIRAIAYAQSIGHGGFSFTLTSGTRLNSGHAFRDTILAALPLRRRKPCSPRRLSEPDPQPAP